MVLKLRAQATLATRPEKQIKSLAGLTRDWRERATRLLRYAPTSIILIRTHGRRGIG
jgi:putative conjugal transfer protein